MRYSTARSGLLKAARMAATTCSLGKPISTICVVASQHFSAVPQQSLKGDYVQQRELYSVDKSHPLGWVHLFTLPGPVRSCNDFITGSFHCPLHDRIFPLSTSQQDLSTVQLKGSKSPG